jgi:hypothetical protein
VETHIRRLTLAAALRGLWGIRAVLLAAGLAALTATAASWLLTHLTGPRSDWAGALQIFAIGIAAVFLGAAFGYSRLVPRSAAAAIAGGGESPRFPSAIVLILLGVLAVLALLQAPAVMAWWTADRALLVEAMGAGRDPVDVRIIPTVILLSLPTLAAIAIAACVLTSLAGVLVRGDLAFPLLAACASLQAGLVVGERLVLHAGRALGSTVRTLVEQSSDQVAIAQVSGWLARHDAPAADVSWRLIWLLCGYGVAVAAAAITSAGRTSSDRSPT